MSEAEKLRRAIENARTPVGQFLYAVYEMYARMPEMEGAEREEAQKAYDEARDFLTQTKTNIEELSKKALKGRASL